MTRKTILGLAVAAGFGGLVGCNSASSPVKATAATPPAKDPTTAMKEQFEKGTVQAGDTAKNLADKTKDAAKDAMDKSKDVAKSVSDTTKDAAKDAMDKTKDLAKGALDKSKDVAKGIADKAKDMTGKATDAAKESFLKPVTDAMPGIESKIKDMKGDAGTKATAAYDGLKKLVEEYKAAPAEKLGELGEKITKALAELKKSVGL